WSQRGPRHRGRHHPRRVTTAAYCPPPSGQARRFALFKVLGAVYFAAHRRPALSRGLTQSAGRIRLLGRWRQWSVHADQRAAEPVEPSHYQVLLYAAVLKAVRELVLVLEGDVVARSNG